MKYLKKLSAVFLTVTAIFTGPALAYGPAGTPDDWPPPMPDDMKFGMFLIDRAEATFADGEDAYVWDAQGWYGGDYNRAWLKTEGEGVQGKSPEDAEVQLLYARMVRPFWDLQFGLRQDFRPQPQRTHAVLGLQGVVPYEFDVALALFLSNTGTLTARAEFEYELLLTQRLILQPRLEVNATANDDAEIGLRRGLNSSELGFRLRYEVVRKIAPYVGLSWLQQYGATGNATVAEGGDASTLSLVAGLRLWF